MYRKTEDFLKEWKYESEGTIKLFGFLTDASLSFHAGENVRDIRTLAWHITVSLAEMMNHAGLEVEGPENELTPPSTIKELIDTYTQAAASVAKEVQSKWPDNSLTDEIPMYGRTWTKGATLSILINHQAHHRGQLSILMRLAGLKVSGVYGPAKEEWAAMGMEPAK